jgi:outer membrane murein-binding lipoprotein Lpp
MEVREFQAIQDKIDKAKSDKAKAEGSIEQIEKSWKDDFQCNSIDEVQAKIKELTEQITSLEQKRNKHIADIEKAMGEIQ